MLNEVQTYHKLHCACQTVNMNVAQDNTRLSVWHHFAKIPPAPDGSSQAKCNHCHNDFKTGSGNSTSNLRKHVKVCFVISKITLSSP